MNLNRTFIFLSKYYYRKILVILLGIVSKETCGCVNLFQNQQRRIVYISKINNSWLFNNWITLTIVD